MPRVSNEALSSVTNLAAIDAQRRPDPPASLDEEAAVEWRKIVGVMAPSWFSAETHALLEDRCRQVVWLRRTHERIAELVKDPDFDDIRYQMLVKLASTQSRTIVHLDTKMRLTQQSTFDQAKKKHSGKSSRKPWEID